VKDKPTRLQLWQMAQQLRGANTTPFPMQIAEAVQHAIVRLEDLAQAMDASLDEAANHYARARELHAFLLSSLSTKTAGGG
jgi:hypothetical protein